MAEHKIGCLPVVDGREIVGILTETDVLHYFATQPRAPVARGARCPDARG